MKNDLAIAFVSSYCTEDVRNVFITGDMAELNQSGSNGFAYTMVGEGDMSLGKPGVWDGCTLDN